MTWAALRRTGQYPGGFETFLDEAEIVEAEAEQEVDPTERGSYGRLLVDLTLATGIPFREWLETDEEVIATVLAVYERAGPGRQRTGRDDRWPAPPY